ncbi:MAG: tyrosine-type recombinase/integrase [Pseudomonadota bacterium]
MTAGRRRMRANAHLPKGVEKSGNNWVYRPYLGVVNGKKTYGKRVRLCSLRAPVRQLFEAYDMATGDSANLYTVAWLINAYMNSPHVKSLPAKTQADFEIYQKSLIGQPTNDGRTLGAQKLEHIQSPLIRRFLDRYKDGKHPVAANRRVQFLKAAWNYMAQRDARVPRINPCEKVTLNREVSRDRYVTDEELQRYKSLCSQRSYMPLAMELAYLCRLRANEVYSIRKNDICEAGLRVYRSKGSRGEITKWTPRLIAAVKDSLEWNAEVDKQPIQSEWLLHDRKGSRYTISNHKSQWARLQKAADAAGIERFTFHDLKAKGYTDQEEQDAGHKSEKMASVYDRRGRLVAPADGEQVYESRIDLSEVFGLKLG